MTNEKRQKASNLGTSRTHPIMPGSPVPSPCATLRRRHGRRRRVFRRAGAVLRPLVADQVPVRRPAVRGEGVASGSLWML